MKRLLALLSVIALILAPVCPAATITPPNLSAVTTVNSGDLFVVWPIGSSGPLSQITFSNVETAVQTHLNTIYLQSVNNLSDVANVATSRTNLGLGTAALQSTGTSGMTVPFLNGANTWSGVNTFTSGAVVGSSSALTLDGAAGTNRLEQWTTALTVRWGLLANGTAEGGSNTGTDLQVNRYADNGALIDNPILITRATGLVNFNDGISVSSIAGLPPGTTVGGNAVVTTNDSRFGGPTQNAQSVNYTLVASDAGKQIFLTFSGAQTLTIPSNASVAFPVGTKIEVATSGSTTATISINSDTLWWSPSGATGSRSLSTFSLITLTKITGTGWFITGSGVS